MLSMGTVCPDIVVVSCLNNTLSPADFPPEPLTGLYPLRHSTFLLPLMTIISMGTPQYSQDDYIEAYFLA